jgi:hypothetical protein
MEAPYQHRRRWAMEEQRQQKHGSNPWTTMIGLRHGRLLKMCPLQTRVVGVTR